MRAFVASVVSIWASSYNMLGFLQSRTPVTSVVSVLRVQSKTWVSAGLARRVEVKWIGAIGPSIFA